MINEKVLTKVSLFLIIICGLFLFVPNTVIAAESPIQIEHKSNVPPNKVWKINFNKPIIEDKLSERVKVYNRSIEAIVKISYDSKNNAIIVEPPVSGYIAGQTYCLQINEAVTDLDNKPLKAAVIMNFTIAVPAMEPLEDTINKKYIFKQYDNTLDQMAVTETKLAPKNIVMNYDLTSSYKDIYEYLNPKNFEYHSYGVYQFLTLNYIEGITAEELDAALVGQGILEGQGKTILEACEEYDVNPAYIVSHAILESAHGTSQLAKGYPVSIVDGKAVPSKITYNMFGIGAHDIAAIKLGAESAYKQGWFTPEAAIEGGIKWISDNYINSTIYKQNTIYKMRWNPTVPWHQYATDISWAYKQSYNIKQILDKCTNAKLTFEIPKYK